MGEIEETIFLTELLKRIGCTRKGLEVKVSRGCWRIEDYKRETGWELQSLWSYGNNEWKGLALFQFNCEEVSGINESSASCRVILRKLLTLDHRSTCHDSIFKRGKERSRTSVKSH